MLRSGGLILFLSLLNPIPLYASGSYYVGKDAGGVCFQIARDGGWYINKEDLRFFKIGNAGTYSIGKDMTGTYLSTDKNRKYYLDMGARAKLFKETAAFNAGEEKRLRDLSEGENKRRQEAKDNEAAAKGDKQAPQPVKVEITVTSQGYDENNRSETYIGPGYYSYRRPMLHHRPKDPPSPKVPPPITDRDPQGMQPKNFPGGKDRHIRDIDLTCPYFLGSKNYTQVYPIATDPKSYVIQIRSNLAYEGNSLLRSTNFGGGI